MIKQLSNYKILLSVQMKIVLYEREILKRYLEKLERNTIITCDNVLLVTLSNFVMNG